MVFLSACKSNKNCNGLDKDNCLSKTTCSWKEEVKEGKVIKSYCVAASEKEIQELKKKKEQAEKDFQKMKKQMDDTDK